MILRTVGAAKEAFGSGPMPMRSADVLGAQQSASCSSGAWEDQTPVWRGIGFEEERI